MKETFSKNLYERELYLNFHSRQTQILTKILEGYFTPLKFTQRTKRITFDEEKNAKNSPMGLNFKKINEICENYI